MKISYNWLKDFIDIQEEPVKLGEILTNIGLEVEGIEFYQEVEGGLEGLVIGEVVACEKHPDADKLSITKVNIGSDELLPIVCGAPNVAAGQKVVVATQGTTLTMNGESLTLRKVKIRGQVSEGMICAEDEIGLGDSHEGIMVLDPAAIPGTPAQEYFNIATDTVFEIGLTPNRIDAASHFGTARDLAAYFRLSKPVELRKPFITEIVPDNHNRNIDVEIQDPEGCRRFTGVTITEVNIAPSPDWLQNRLRAIGLSPINNVVDITNYVLHELGQPLHAYDADKLNDDKIIVRRMPQDTGFVTLDEEERKLDKDDVMVCDAREGVCIAGVFGGLHSGVSESTKNIFLESAYFDPVFIRKTAKRHGLNTDSSFRFERGVDPENTLVALKRAAALIRDISGGKISSEILDVHPAPIKPCNIKLSYAHVDRLIGKSIERDLIRKILKSLDIKVLEENTEGLVIEVAPYRVDVTREADVIEEILRIYGYNNVEFTDKLHTSVSHQEFPDNEKLVNFASDFLTANGFTEIMCNSLTRGEYYQELSTFPAKKSVPIMNPLSADLNVMRQTLLFGGMETIARNINHKNPDLRLYEYGRVYELAHEDVSKFENFNEYPVFGMFLTGKVERSSWTSPEKSTDFYQLKAYYLNFLRKLGADSQSFTQEPVGAPDIFSGGLTYRAGKDPVLRAGKVSSKVLKTFDIEQEVYFAELYWNTILKLVRDEKSFRELPKFPEVRRDLALLIDEGTEYSEIERLVSDAGRGLLKRIELFDFYKGKNIPDGKKSYAVSIYLQDINKTLTDKEIDQVMNKIIARLKKDMDATLR